MLRPISPNRLLSRKRVLHAPWKTITTPSACWFHSMKLCFLDIFLLFTLFIFFLSSQFFFGCRYHIFRLHKVYRTRYFRLICLILICQRKKRWYTWLQFECPFCASDIYKWFLSTLHTDRSVHSSHWNESSRSQSQRVCWCKSRTFVIGISLANSLPIKKLNEFEWI